MRNEWNQMPASVQVSAAEGITFEGDVCARLGQYALGVGNDGGAIYNLSASPGTLITENYIFNNSGRIGIYLDEGSRYITVRRNVVQDATGSG